MSQPAQGGAVHTPQLGDGGGCTGSCTPCPKKPIPYFNADSIPRGTGTALAGVSRDQLVKPSGALGEEPAPSFPSIYINLKATAPCCSGNYFSAL